MKKNESVLHPMISHRENHTAIFIIEEDSSIYLYWKEIKNQNYLPQHLPYSFIFISISMKIKESKLSFISLRSFCSICRAEIRKATDWFYLHLDFTRCVWQYENTKTVRGRETNEENRHFCRARQFLPQLTYTTQEKLAKLSNPNSIATLESSFSRERKEQNVTRNLLLLDDA